MAYLKGIFSPLQAGGSGSELKKWKVMCTMEDFHHSFRAVEAVGRVVRMSSWWCHVTPRFLVAGNDLTKSVLVELQGVGCSQGSCWAWWMALPGKFLLKFEAFEAMKHGVLLNLKLGL
ncbi:Uncharacterized protein Fot_22331 [Forsythia ovata]|uniref:Uncharacterized protein n=1 Tax=Forsythia ovata TaxID=205694 RepID=A0ABD1UZ32_9LAMI